jgi:hypothetical protein
MLGGKMSLKLMSRLAGTAAALTLGAAGFTGTALATGGAVHNVDGPPGANGTASGPTPGGAGNGGAGGAACDGTGKTGAVPATTLLASTLKGSAAEQCGGMY